MKLRALVFSCSYMKPVRDLRIFYFRVWRVAAICLCLLMTVVICLSSLVLCLSEVSVVLLVTAEILKGAVAPCSVLVIAERAMVKFICRVVRLQVPENACSIVIPGRLWQILTLLGMLGLCMNLTHVLLSIISMLWGICLRKVASLLWRMTLLAGPPGPYMKIMCA